MLSLRTLARSAPQALSRRAVASLLRQSAVARPCAIVKPARLSALQSNLAAFSTTAGHGRGRGQRAASSETDDQLLAKLDSELQLEEEMKVNEQRPASITDFLANTPFEVHDTPGQEVVKLVRSIGDEKITVSFSISDLSNYDPFNQEAALDDEVDLEDEVVDKPNARRDARPAGGSRSAPAEEQAEEDMDDEATEEPAPPISLTVVIEKPGKAPGALTIDASAQDGNIVVENVFYYEDAKVAVGGSPDASHKRNDAYPGPPFGSLDEDLQVLIERFLEERGITQAMAVVLPDYVDMKEQAEYQRWLQNVREFVDV